MSEENKQRLKEYQKNKNIVKQKNHCKKFYLFFFIHDIKNGRKKLKKFLVKMVSKRICFINANI